MRTVRRAVQIIEALSRESDGIGLMNLAESLQEPPSSVHRLINVLIEEDLVVRDELSKRFRMGPALLRWAQASLTQNDMAEAGRPILAALRDEISESVFLTELIADEAVCVASAESPRPLRFFMRVGQRMPYHVAASARAILAFQSDDLIDRVLKEASTSQDMESPPLSLNDVRDELHNVRQRGYAMCDEEMEVGVTALSVPIRNAVDRVVGSITVVAPAHRLPSDRRNRIRLKLVAAANQISAKLGHTDSESNAVSRSRNRPR
jgi:DNA-binding IclR family transcriptional regulator